MAEVRDRLNRDFSAGEVRTYHKSGGGELHIRWRNVATVEATQIR